MLACSIVREQVDDRAVIRLAGVFDRASAFELRDRLEREPARDVVLDFSLVRQFADLGVATLAHGLAGGERRLRLLGLRSHQRRIFRYFGVDVDELGSGDGPGLTAAP
jgi:anti-anti-sigma regulatory factor